MQLAEPLWIVVRVRICVSTNLFLSLIVSLYLVFSGCDPVNDDPYCCSSSRQCGLGEGDCDDDEDCSGETWFVAQTTVQLAEPLWIVVKVSILVSISLFLIYVNRFLVSV